MFKRTVIVLIIIIAGVSTCFSALDPVTIFGKPWEDLAREERHEFWRMRTVHNYEPDGKPRLENLDKYIRIFQIENVYDPKYTVFEVQAENTQGTTITLTGEVLIPGYKSGVERVLGILGFENIENKIKVLPDPALGDKGYAVGIKDEVSIKRSPQKKSEQLNQALKGDPIYLLKQNKTGEFFLVQDPVGYVGWVAAEDIKRMTLEEWTQYRKIKKDDSLSRKKVLEYAAPVMGVPYVWGGITEDGLDCSGFTQYVYRKRGVILPRDANQQAAVGRLVGFSGYMDNLRAGDLIFFCGSTGRVSHVAISLGGYDFIESSSGDGVHISSLDPERENFKEKSRTRYLFVRRILMDGF